MTTLYFDNYEALRVAFNAVAANATDPVRIRRANGHNAIMTQDRDWIWFRVRTKTKPKPCPGHDVNIDLGILGKATRVMHPDGCPE